MASNFRFSTWMWVASLLTGLRGARSGIKLPILFEKDVISPKLRMLEVLCLKPEPGKICRHMALLDLAWHW
jgi:hypothetical protein